jgi:hypothetical protein
MSRLLKSSIALGASPLIIGTLIYFTWRLTRWSWLEMMGLATLLIGIVAFFAGMICLILHLKHQSKSNQTAQRTLIIRTLLVGGLLIVNFPVAAIYASSAIDISTRYTVRVYNDSFHAIESFVILGPNIQTEMGPIPAGKKAVQHNYPKGDGCLRFTARQGQVCFDGELEGYVTGNSSGDKNVRVSSKGIYKIKDNLR